MMRKPSCLISCSHCSPEGGCGALMGRHGAMNPAGRARRRDNMDPRIGNRWLAYNRDPGLLYLMARGHASAERSGGNGMDLAGKRGEIIRHVEDALAIADEIEDGEAGGTLLRLSYKPLLIVCMACRFV